MESLISLCNGVVLQLHGCFFFTVYLRCADETSADVLNHHRDLFQTLANAQAIHILTNQHPPEGCAISTVSAKCEVHMMLKVKM